METDWSKNMENTNNENIEVETEVKDGVSTEGTTPETEVETEETLTISKTDYDRAIQSAEDKVRGKLSKEIKDLKEQIKELTPVEKSPAELDLEKRIKALEDAEKNLAEQKKKLDFQDTLASKGLDKSLADYMKEDADIDGIVNIIDEIVKSRMKSNGYVPSEHSSDEKITPEEFKNMSYSQKVALMSSSPELYKRLSGRG